MKRTINRILSLATLSVVAMNGLAAHAADTLITRFDAAKGQLPEGLAVNEEGAVVGIAGSGEVWKIGFNGQRTLLGNAPAPIPGKGFLTGLIFAPNGDVLAALASFSNEVQPGIYRIPRTGGTARLFAKHPQMSFPNGLAYDSLGNLLVTDSAGSIFEISEDGETKVVLADEKLKGDKTGRSSSYAPGARFGLDIGVNGIAFGKNGLVYLANSDKGSLLKFRWDAQTRRAGPLEVLVQDGERLGGADGIALDERGDVIVALNTKDALVRVDGRGRISSVPVTAKLDFPASIAIMPTGKNAAVYVTNAGFLSEKKQPSLVRLTGVAPQAPKK